MLSLGKVAYYVQQLTEPEAIKLYYEKCIDGLKAANKRSNFLSQIVLLVILLNFFSNKITELTISGIKIDIKVVTVISPTVLSFILFEWLMIAKRRRDLIVGIQQVSYKLFKIEPLEEERYFPSFNPNTLNVMPFSIMLEAITIDTKSKFRQRLFRVTILFIPIPLISVILIAFLRSFSIYNMHLRYNFPSSFEDFKDNLTIYLCFISSGIFIVWSLFYYYTEFTNLKVLKEAARNLKQ